jgi:PhnB protein
MSSFLNPYISFAGNAREAMEYYQQVFGGELRMNTFGEFGAPYPEMTDKIMHGQLEAPNGFRLMGADNPPDQEHQAGGAITISLSGDDAELRGYWEKLTDGGTVTVPLEKQMWGDEFGMCTDRFGVAWMVNIGPTQG